MTEEAVKETYTLFGMTPDDIEDVNAIIHEEGDKVDLQSREINYTKHQLEFKNICAKINSDKASEVFLKHND